MATGKQQNNIPEHNTSYTDRISNRPISQGERAPGCSRGSENV